MAARTTTTGKWPVAERGVPAAPVVPNRPPAPAQIRPISNLTPAEVIGLYPASFDWLDIPECDRHAYIDDRIACARDAGGARFGLPAEEIRALIDMIRGVADLDESTLLWNVDALRRVPGVTVVPESEWDAPRGFCPPLWAIVRHPRRMVPKWLKFAVWRAVEGGLARVLRRLARMHRYTYWSVGTHNIPAGHAGSHTYLHQLPISVAVVTLVRWMLRERAHDRRTAARGAGAK